MVFCYRSLGWLKPLLLWHQHRHYRVTIVCAPFRKIPSECNTSYRSQLRLWLLVSDSLKEFFLRILRQMPSCESHAGAGRRKIKAKLVGDAFPSTLQSKASQSFSNSGLKMAPQTDDRRGSNSQKCVPWLSPSPPSQLLTPVTEDGCSSFHTGPR